MKGEVWVVDESASFGENRVALELLSKGRELSRKLGTRCCAIVLGCDTREEVMELIAHGAEMIYVAQGPHLSQFRPRVYTEVVCRLVHEFQPEIILLGATETGRELAARVAKRLDTGLSADCLDLEIDEETGNLVQLAPAFGGKLLAEVVCPERRPQMATVRPGTFPQLLHDPKATAPVLYLDTVDAELEEEWEVVAMEVAPEGDCELESAPVVVSAGAGVTCGEAFHLVIELARALGAQLGGTRPLVQRGLLPQERMIGQTGKTIRPKVLITVGTSGALQYASGIRGSEFIIAIDKNPMAPIFDEADLGIVGDASDILSRLVSALSSVRKENDLEAAHG